MIISSNVILLCLCLALIKASPLHRLDSIVTNISISSVINSFLKIDIPETVDWRLKGAVTEPKDQRDCGCCYAFSTVGAIESQIWIKTGKLIDLSVQQILDCDGISQQCHGGFSKDNFNYIIEAGGIETEKTYPYVSGYKSDEIYKCKFNKTHSVATVTGFVQIPKGDEEALMAAVATMGPVSVSLCVSYDIGSYTSGIFKDKLPDHKELNHAALVVGYGNDNITGIPYWLLKNAYGKEWGENGYFRIERNKNSCYVAQYALYPIVSVT